VRSYDPTNGELLWEMSVRGGRSSASATGDRERLYVSSERRDDGGGHLFAVKAGASGDISLRGDEAANSGVAWWQENAAPPMASPLVYRGIVYVFKRRTGVVLAFDAESGEELYKKRLPGAPGFWASPWAYDGKVFGLDDAGTTHVLRAGREFEILGTNPLEEQVRASPALTPDGLVFRGVGHVFFVGR
jgi:outer membrane protein assembly factor BamB